MFRIAEGGPEPRPGRAAVPSLDQHDVAGLVLVVQHDRPEDGGSQPVSLFEIRRNIPQVLVLIGSSAIFASFIGNTERRNFPRLGPVISLSHWPSGFSLPRPGRCEAQG